MSSAADAARAMWSLGEGAPPVVAARRTEAGRLLVEPEYLIALADVA